MSISQLSSMTCFTKASGNFALLKTTVFLLQLHDFGLGVMGLQRRQCSFVCRQQALQALSILASRPSCDQEAYFQVRN